MRDSKTYRGAKRNMARRQRMLGQWRTGTQFSGQANVAAKLHERAVQANSAREAVAKAHTESGVLATQSVVIDAYLKFYTQEKRTRVVNRILSELHKQKRTPRLAA